MVRIYLIFLFLFIIFTGVFSVAWGSSLPLIRIHPQEEVILTLSVPQCSANTGRIFSKPHFVPRKTEPVFNGINVVEMENEKWKVKFSANRFAAMNVLIGFRYNNTKTCDVARFMICHDLASIRALAANQDIQFPDVQALYDIAGKNFIMTPKEFFLLDPMSLSQYFQANVESIPGIYTLFVLGRRSRMNESEPTAPDGFVYSMLIIHPRLLTSRDIVDWEIPDKLAELMCLEVVERGWVSRGKWGKLFHPNNDNFYYAFTSMNFCDSYPASDFYSQKLGSYTRKYLLGMGYPVQSIPDLSGTYDLDNGMKNFPERGRSLKGPLFVLRPMKKQFWQQDCDLNTPYFNAETRRFFEVKVVNGHLEWVIPLPNQSPVIGNLDKTICVIGADGKIYLNRTSGPKDSSFLAGAAVAYSGHVSLKDGLIHVIDWEGDRYDTKSQIYIQQVLNYFNSLKILSPDLTVVK